MNPAQSEKSTRIARIEQDVDDYIAGWPLEVKTLPELRDALERAKQPIDWANIFVPCGVADAMEEDRLGRIEYIEELIAAHEGKDRTSDIVRTLQQMLRKPYEDRLVDFIHDRFETYGV